MVGLSMNASTGLRAPPELDRPVGWGMTHHETASAPLIVSGPRFARSDLYPYPYVQPTTDDCRGQATRWGSCPSTGTRSRGKAAAALLQGGRVACRVGGWQSTERRGATEQDDHGGSLHCLQLP